MDDYNSNLLNDSKSEWSIRLMNILSGHIIDGFRSIFSEAMEICEKNDEAEKYLMTFQNYLSMVPKWNQKMVETEVERIKTCSQCKYLEDLITCVHILQLKLLSCVRTGNENKKIDIDIPCFKSFLHNVYINIARKLYGNIYIFQIDASPLQQQKHNREFEIIVQCCIMNTIRDNIPVEQLLKQYIDETQEVDIEKTEKIIEQEHNPTLDKSQEEKNKREIDNTPLLTNDNNNGEVITLNETPPTVDEFSELSMTDEVEEQKEHKSITFSNDTIKDQWDDDKTNALTIGDNVPLDVDGDFDNRGSSNMNEIEEINLDFDNIDNIDNIDNESAITGGSEPPIELGIEELII
jgi:hypothetical protein